MQTTIVPSLPAASFEELQRLAGAIVGVVPELQIDIVDGRFVEAVSWPFTEVEPREALKAIHEFADNFAIEMDCMVLDPAQYLDQFVALGVRRVIVHLGSTDDVQFVISHARHHGYRIGIAFTNDVSLADLEPLIPKVDFVQVMGIAVVGKQGQPFDTRTLDTVRTLRLDHPDLEIAVDGSVNADTIVPLFQAGVNRFAPGSAIAKQPDPVAAYHHLQSLLTKQD